MAGTYFGLNTEAEMLSCLKFAALLALLAPGAYGLETAQLSADQSSVLESARTLAIQYTHVLPDFICTQTTHRSTGRNGDNSANMGAGISGRSPIASMAGASGYSSDVIEEQLTYVGGKESYEVLTVNGKKVHGVDHLRFKGAISEGEFGSLLVEIFDPTSHTAFTWGRAANVHGRHAWMYDFVVPKESGTEVIARDSDKEILVAISGKVSIDPKTKDVLEISSNLDLPPNFPIRIAQRSIEFAPREIAGKSYNLPTRSLVHMEDSKSVYDNRIDFTDYHRFASESTIHFDNANPPQ
jgi:hypothetical protein